MKTIICHEETFSNTENCNKNKNINDNSMLEINTITQIIEKLTCSDAKDINCYLSISDS